MNAPNQQASALITQTVNAFNSDVTTLSPMDGISLIDNWTSVLRQTDDASTNPVTNLLGELKQELQSGNPHSDRIEQFLNELAEQAQQAAQSADGANQANLNQLAQALQGLGQQLSGQNGPANTGGNAPGGPTTSGPPIAGYTTGGPTDGDMDDTTGSLAGTSGTSLGADVAGAGMRDDASDSVGGSSYGQNQPDQGNTQGGGSYGSGYGTGSEGRDQTRTSGTGLSQSTGSVGASTPGGAGISGGQADSEGGSSSHGTGV